MDSEHSVVVVDDSAFFRGMLASMLTEQGIATRVAPGGEEGWQMIQEFRPQVVVTDWMMPEVDGLALCRMIRDSRDHRHIHVILLTSKDQVEDAIAALEQGADDFISKSADPREVVVRVKAGLRLAELHEALMMAERRLAVAGMAAALGHEIFNPLQVVTGFAEMLARDESLPSARRENAAAMLAAARRIHDLVKRIQEIGQPRYTAYVGDSRMIDLEDNAPPGADTRPSVGEA